MIINKPDASEYPAYFNKYISKVEQNNLTEALNYSREKLLALINGLPPEKYDYRYADGKWSIKEMLAHIIDCERVFAYRALTFARNDKNGLPGFDENEWAAESNAGNRKMDLIVEEYQLLSRANILFFEALSSEAANRKGKANNNEISVRAIGFVIAGHELHHMQVLEEKYLHKGVGISFMK